MSSRGKKKTTMAKLARESRLRERRLDKESRKQARREEALRQPVSDHGEEWETADADPGEDPQHEEDPARAGDPRRPPAREPARPSGD